MEEIIITEKKCILFWNSKEMIDLKNIICYKGYLQISQQFACFKSSEQDEIFVFNF